MAKKPKSLPSPVLAVFYATNRRRHSDAFDKTAAEHPDDSRLWLGKAAVEWLSDPEKTEAPRRLLAHPEVSGDDNFGDVDSGPAAALLDAWLLEARDRGAVALFFVHGFSNSFGSALARAAQITEFYSPLVPLVPFAFSWPSDGEPIAPRQLLTPASGAIAQYRSDQADAKDAGRALARLLREIHRARGRAARTGAPPRMVLLAHSMGNHALASALAVMRHGLLTAPMAGTFDHAVLAAADVDHAALSPAEALSEIAFLATDVTVLTSFDGMLDIASGIANNGSLRLGHYGPADIDQVAPNVTVVDYWPGLQAPHSKPDLFLQGGFEWDIVEHQYYRNDRKARADLAELLAGRPPPGRVVLARKDRVQSRRARHATLAFTGP